MNVWLLHFSFFYLKFFFFSQMTGLDVETDRILEVACVITDENLNTVSDEFHMVLHQPDRYLNRMDEWCAKTHGTVW